MQHRFATLLLLLSLFATAPANRAWACGSHEAGHAEQFHEKAAQSSCCSGDADSEAAHCGSDADACNQSHSGQPCPDDDGCGGCHCPGCGTTCHAPAAFAPAGDAVSLPFIFAASVQRQAFYFAQHLPEAVYLPIWQPPQLGV